jgi:hypothetical protein
VSVYYFEQAAKYFTQDGPWLSTARRASRGAYLLLVMSIFSLIFTRSRAYPLAARQTPGGGVILRASDKEVYLGEGPGCVATWLLAPGLNSHPLRAIRPLSRCASHCTCDAFNNNILAMYVCACVAMGGCSPWARVIVHIELPT